jgi:hypothetical protein
MTAIRPRTFFAPVVLVGLLAFCLLALTGARGDAGPPDPAALDAGLALVDAGPVAAPEVPIPTDPVTAPGDALEAFRLWWRTGWVYAILWGVASVLVAVSTRVKRLQTGKAAVITGTLIATLVTVLTAKAAGMADAAAIAAGFHVLAAGGFWLLKKNAATVDLSTATPEQIAAALAAANKPPAFPGPPVPRP